MPFSITPWETIYPSLGWPRIRNRRPTDPARRAGRGGRPLARKSVRPHVADRATLLRRRVTAESEAEFPVLRDYRAAGMTEYVAIINRFAPEGVIGEMDCVYSSAALGRRIPRGHHPQHRSKPLSAAAGLAAPWVDSILSSRQDHLLAIRPAVSRHTWMRHLMKAASEYLGLYLVPADSRCRFSGTSPGARDHHNQGSRSSRTPTDSQLRA